jgi:hypothetical protein
MYQSTAKQRLWLSCLGFEIVRHASGYEVQAYFEDPTYLNRYRAQPNAVQKDLCQKFCVPINTDDRQVDVAGRLYDLFLSHAWVCSVYRHWTGAKGSRHRELPLAPHIAYRIAQKVALDKFCDDFKQFPTTGGRDSDVFYRMSKQATISIAYIFVVLEFENSGVDRHVPKRPLERRRVNANVTQRHDGCLLRLAILFAITLFSICFFVAGS